MGMTTTLIQPTARADVEPQDIALRNLDMLMHVQGKYRKDLARHLGRIPQALSRMMKSGSAWTFNDMCKAADFVGVPVGTLLDPTLTPTKAAALSGNHDNEDIDDGGSLVGGDAGRRRTGSGAIRLTLAA